MRGEREVVDGWIVNPENDELVVEAGRPDRQVQYLAEVAGEWRTSPASADLFDRFPGGPTTYRIPQR